MDICFFGVQWIYNMKKILNFYFALQIIHPPHISPSSLCFTASLLASRSVSWLPSSGIYLSSHSFPLSNLAFPVLSFFSTIVLLNGAVDQTVIHLNFELFYCHSVLAFLCLFPPTFSTNFSYFSCSSSRPFLPHTNTHFLTTSRIPSTSALLVANFPPLSS